MQFEENENFEIVLPRRKKSNTKNTKQLNLDEVRPVRKSSTFHDDEGIGSASPTYESDDHPHQTGTFWPQNTNRENGCFRTSNSAKEKIKVVKKEIVEKKWKEKS